jgi:hypothetical protein
MFFVDAQNEAIRLSLLSWRRNGMTAGSEPPKVGQSSKHKYLIKLDVNNSWNSIDGSDAGGSNTARGS